MDSLAEHPADFLVQAEQLGTAHAVGVFLNHYPHVEGRLLVMNGDTPLLRKTVLEGMLMAHDQQNAQLSLLTAEVPEPTGYGRIVRDGRGLLERIVEEVDATEAERELREINAGIYVFDLAKLRQWLPQVQNANRQHEYYLPDVLAVALAQKATILALKAAAEDVAGINTRAELAAASKTMRRRINEHWMLAGVTLQDPETAYIDADVRIGTDAVIHPNVYLEGSTLIGSDVTIYPGCRISDSYIESGCVVYENCSLDSAQLEADVKIGPFARLRPGSIVAKNARVGNFVELKKTVLGEGSKANHLAYLGDATIGKGVNIGAGTITCNYDGEHKFPTVIEDGVFVGSDSQLVAPVTLGKDAYIAAGSSITEDVPAGSLAIARGRQVNKPGWAKKKKTTKTPNRQEKHK